MKQKELRIGNYCLRSNYLCKVSAIFTTHFWVVDGYGIDHGISIKDKLKPIPLTEEWLLEFGFKKANEKEIYPNSFIKNNVLRSRLYLRTYYKGGYLWGFITKSKFELTRHHEFYDGKPIYYVHQLQNLYFALTGKELTPNISTP